MTLLNLTYVFSTSAIEEKSVFPHMRILIIGWSLQLLVRKENCYLFQSCTGFEDPVATVDVFW